MKHKCFLFIQKINNNTTKYNILQYTSHYIAQIKTLLKTHQYGGSDNQGWKQRRGGKSSAPTNSFWTRCRR